MTTHRDEVQDAVAGLIVALYRMNVADEKTVLSLRVNESLKRLDDTLDGQITRWGLIRAPGILRERAQAEARKEADP